MQLNEVRIAIVTSPRVLHIIMCLIDIVVIIVYYTVQLTRNLTLAHLGLGKDTRAPAKYTGWIGHGHESAHGMPPRRTRGTREVWWHAQSIINVRDVRCATIR